MIHNNSLGLIHQLPHIMLRPQGLFHNQTMQDESLNPEQTSTEEFFEIVVLGAGMTVSEEILYFAKNLCVRRRWLDHST